MASIVVVVVEQGQGLDRFAQGFYVKIGHNPCDGISRMVVGIVGMQFNGGSDGIFKARGPHKCFID